MPANGDYYITALGAHCSSHEHPILPRSVPPLMAVYAVATMGNFPSLLHPWSDHP